MELQWQFHFLGQLHKHLQLDPLVSDGNLGHLKVYAHLSNAVDVHGRYIQFSVAPIIWWT